MTALPTDTDTVTILRSRGGVLTKRIGYGPTGWQVTGFSAGVWYAALLMPATCFDEMTVGLDWLSGQQACAIVRGQLRAGVDRTRCRRLCDRALHGDAVTFEPAARRWWIDIDGLPIRTAFAAEPEAGVEHVIGLLPEPSTDAPAGGRRPARPASSPASAAGSGSGSAARSATPRPRAGWQTHRSTAACSHRWPCTRRQHRSWRLAWRTR